MGGWTAGPLEWSEQPGDEDVQNCGDCSGLESSNADPTHHTDSTVLWILILTSTIHQDLNVNYWLPSLRMFEQYTPSVFFNEITLELLECHLSFGSVFNVSLYCYQMFYEGFIFIWILFCNRLGAESLHRRWKFLCFSSVDLKMSPWTLSGCFNWWRIEDGCNDDDVHGC